VYKRFLLLHPSPSPVFTRPRHGPSAETGSLSSWFGAGIPNNGPTVGTATSPTPSMQGKATSGNPDPSSSHPHISTTIPPSHPLVHFTDYTATSSCSFLETDLGVYKDLWWFSLIGFIVGKFPRYSSISKYVTSAWQCHVNFSMHDSGWLIFKFTSELDMLVVLSEGPYHVFGRPLI
jgi:hypothetical protein